MGQQQRPFVAKPDEWEVIDGNDYEVVPDAPAKPAPTWSDRLGLNQGTASPIEGFMRGSGAGLVDLIQGAVSNVAGQLQGKQAGDQQMAMQAQQAAGSAMPVKRPDIAAEQVPQTPNTISGKVGAVLPVVGELAATAGPPVSEAIDAIPSARKAGALFQDVMGAAKNVPVDVEAPGKVALRIQQLSERGGSLPKAVRDYLKYATDPEKPKMTYEVSRDFASNISRLSANEMGRLTPVMAREVAELRVALNEANAQAAQAAGKAAEYKQAMTEYAKAMRVRDAINEVVQGAKKSVPYATAAGAGYWLTRKVKSLMGGED